MSSLVAGSPFHLGEQAVQSRAGVRAIAERSGRFIQHALPDDHRDFFQSLIYVVVGAVDGEGRPWATMLVGAPGFVSSPDEHTLVIDAEPAPGDPIAAGLSAGSPVGVLGIELQTRQRIRANGVLSGASPAHLVIRVDESFGNCPQYIQAREPLSAVRREPAIASAEGARLSERATDVLRAADTLFIASAAHTGAGDGPGGVDVSHRGGKPGFVRVTTAEDRTVVTLPDFAGNNFFMTVGNLHEDARAGIVVVDFDSGALLSLTGTTEVVWDGTELASFSGAKRLVRFSPESGRLLEGAIPFTWSTAAPAPQLRRLGEWPRE